MKLPRHAFFGGRIVPYGEARVGVLTHGLNYGTGVFAGIRGYWNDEEKELFVFRPHRPFFVDDIGWTQRRSFNDLRDQQRDPFAIG